MKRIIAIFLVFTTLVGCASTISTEEPVTSNISSKDFVSEAIPEQYADVLVQYKEIIKIWNSDDEVEGYPNFTEIMENDRYPKPYGSENYPWFEMLVDGKSPKTAEYGYILKDINDDGISEMFWVRDDYTLLATFTIVEGKAITIGAYSAKNKAIILDTGEIYQFDVGGADIGEHTIFKLSSDSNKLCIVKAIGNYHNEFYYEIIDGKKINIGKVKFEEYLNLYPVSATPTESWKANKILWVNTG